MARSDASLCVAGKLGALQEPLFGTTRFYLLLNIFIIMEGVIYVAICYALALLFGADQFLYSSGIGFSGVLFALAVQVCYPFAYYLRGDECAFARDIVLLWRPIVPSYRSPFSRRPSIAVSLVYSVFRPSGIRGYS